MDNQKLSVGYIKGELGLSKDEQWMILDCQLILLENINAYSSFSRIYLSALLYIFLCEVIVISK